MIEYQEYGYSHDQADHTFFYLRDSLMPMLEQRRNQCILDLGCGNGYLVNYLLNQGYNAYGIDASKEGIGIAKKTNPDRFFIQDLSLADLPVELKQNYFDTIIATEVIEHLYDPNGFIDFCKKLLPKNGELIISTPYHGYLKNLLLSIFDKWDSHHAPAWHGGHIKFWSRKTLSNLLTSKGFTVVDYKGCGRAPYFWKSMIIKAKLI